MREDAGGDYCIAAAAADVWRGVETVVRTRSLRR
jgi:hypothetical protein